MDKPFHTGGIIRGAGPLIRPPEAFLASDHRPARAVAPAQITITLGPDHPLMAALRASAKEDRRG